MIDLAQLGTMLAAAVTGAATVGGAAWAWWQKHQRDSAATRADVAESNAAGVVADSQKSVYQTLSDRVNSQEARIKTLEEGLDRERELRRKAEDNVHALQMDNVILRAELRRHGIEVPPPYYLGDKVPASTTT